MTDAPDPQFSLDVFRDEGDGKHYVSVLLDGVIKNTIGPFDTEQDAQGEGEDQVSLMAAEIVLQSLNLA